MENFDLILILKHLIIGLVQGFTEPIPVSSSGHVMIASEILGMGEQGFTFAILTNTASLLAVMFIYREDIIRLITGFLLFIKTRDRRYRTDFNFALYVIIGSIPAGVLGVLLSDIIAESVSMTTIAIMLFVTGIALWLIRNMRGKKTENNIHQPFPSTVVLKAEGCTVGLSHLDISQKIKKQNKPQGKGYGNITPTENVAQLLFQN